MEEALTRRGQERFDFMFLNYRAHVKLSGNKDSWQDIGDFTNFTSHSYITLFIFIVSFLKSEIFLCLVKINMPLLDN